MELSKTFKTCPSSYILRVFDTYHDQDICGTSITFFGLTIEQQRAEIEQCLLDQYISSIDPELRVTIVDPIRLVFNENMDSANVDLLHAYFGLHDVAYSNYDLPEAHKEKATTKKDPPAPLFKAQPSKRERKREAKWAYRR